MAARLRQVVLAARDLEEVSTRLRAALALREPYHDPGVGYFGLRNAVFALGDQFLEVVSPEREGTSAGRMLERRGGDCGYMLMFQVDDLAAARERVAREGIREVFTVELDDIAEVHLHPSDMRGAIVSLSQPRPPESWRWGGEGWADRAAEVTIAGVTVAVADPDAVRARWELVLGAAVPDVEFLADPGEPGLVGVRFAGAGESLRVGCVELAPG